MLPWGIKSLLVVLAVFAVAGALATSVHGQQQEPPTSTPTGTPVPASKLTVPTWAQDARWYHVYVPRFHNGDRSNDPPGALPWTAIWPATSLPTASEAAKLDTRQYGGDLQGLQKRLPYLGDLGINIATFALGRAEKGGDAIALIGVDEALEPATLAEIKALPQVREARALVF